MSTFLNRFWPGRTQAEPSVPEVNPHALDPYRRVAAEYYASPEYQEKAARVFEQMQTIRDRYFAFDLDGTLVCQFSMGVGEELGVGVGDRLIQPGAQSVLDGLRVNNRVIIWTNSFAARAHESIRTSGLKVPNLIEGLVTQEVYQNFLRLRRAYHEQLIKAAEAHPLFDEFEVQKMREGRTKIPSIIGVDALIDDNADMDMDRLEELGALDELPRLMQVPAFDIWKARFLDNHHLRDSFFELGDQLVERFGS
jgi:hypothetical protein